MRSGDTPVLIPNTMVKTWAADGTMLETIWESRWLPDLWEWKSESSSDIYVPWKSNTEIKYKDKTSRGKQLLSITEVNQKKFRKLNEPRILILN